MYKKGILKKALSAVLSLALTAAALPFDMSGGTAVYAASAGVSAERIASDERKIKINDDWRFCLLDKAREMNNSLDQTASRPDYTESGEWSTVQLPHDWSIYQQFSDSEARAAQGSLPGGTGWYRKSFTLPDDMKDQNVVLQFDAVQMVSEVWINGVNLGKQFLGYVTFEYDITKHLKFNGEENVIAVKAYSSKDSARWYSGAGIYGSVYLIATEKVHIPVNGVHVATVVKEDGKYIQPDFHTEPDMDALKQKSTVNVRTNVANKTSSAAEVTVKSTIYSKENPNVASKEDVLTIPAPANGKDSNTGRVDQIIEIANPDLWSVDNPNLYWVKTEIIQDGEVVDTLDTRFGIRYLYLNPGSYDEPYSENNTLGGLFINGEYTRVNGMCEHRDLGALGMETYQAAIDRRIRKLKEMGVNVVRCAHNPVSPEYIEAADRLGMLIFEEGFDQWLKAKNSDDYHNYFNKAADGTTTVFEYSGADGTDTHINWVRTDLEPNCVRDIQAMVDRDKNSPAIFLWSTGNEIYDSSDGHGIDTQWLLSAAVKEIDSLDNIPWTNIVNKETKRTIRPEPEANHAALPNEENGYKTDYSVRGGGSTVEGGPKYGARYGRPISAAPPTWDTGNSKVTRKYGFIDNMAMADIGGHNYSRATNQYNTHKKRYPNASVAGTETVSAFYTRGVYNIEDYQGGNEEGGRWAHGSGYASEWPYNKNFTSASISIREHRDDMMPFMFGEMVWTGHDYLGEPTPHSSPSRSSYFGIIDTAGFEKDAFYMYRSAWTDIPTVHLLPQKWNWEMGTQVPVMVYTNAASVEVFINGKSIGVKAYDRDTAQPVYLDYGYQEYQAGELKAVAKDKDGNVIAEDVVYTAGEAKSVVLSGEKAFIKNDGSDLLYVEATVTDSAGVMVPTADNRITFDVEGGEIVALDNGDPRDREPFRGLNNHNNSNTSDNRKAFNGKALAIIKAEKGAENIVVTARADAAGGQIGSNTLTVGALDEVGDGTGIKDYTLPEITTGVGVSPILPETVGIVYDDGLIQEYAVDSWDDMDKVDLNKPGSYTVYAVSDEVKERVSTQIHVKEISSIDDVEVTTIAGVEPPLPNFVTLNYKDGETGSAQVAWEPVDPALYAEEGVFDVTGKIGPDKTVTAEVMVKEMLSIEEIEISTERGALPTMPSTVKVEFTDGSNEPLGVKWDISENDVKSAGQKKVTGTVLNSATKAVAWLNVSTVVYASDLEYRTETADKVFKDAMSNGERLQARGMQGGPGEVYEKGFGTKAPAEIEIDIAGKGYERFRSYVNLSLLKGGVAAPGAVAFEVYLDDDKTPAFSSGDMDRANEAELVDLDVTGKSKIRLVTKSRSGNEEDDLADWVNARFLSANVVIDKILTPQLYTAKASESPSLPDAIQASVPGIEEPVDFDVTWLTPVSDAMFASGSVQNVYGRVEGAAEKLVLFQYMTDYEKACKTEGFSDKIRSWSVTETFDYGNVGRGQKVKFNAMELTPKLLYSGTSNMLVENVGNYGFSYGIYPDPASGDYAVFATPDLSYFQVKNVANTADNGNNDISNNNSFSFETSVDGENWTAFTDFTKGDILPDTGKGGIWAQRYYTSNENAQFPAGTNFLRVKYPDGQTWKFNMTEIVLKGKSKEDAANADMAGFAIDGYLGTIDQEAKTVSLPVPASLDITSAEPEITVFPGASVSPKGPQDFTNPVTYTVTNGQVKKEYTVTVTRGVNVSFHPYGGTINGSEQEVVNFIPKKSTVLPPADPSREGYLFGGWTTDRAGKEAMQVETMQFEEDTVFYAIWNKDPYVSVRTDADASGKTWQDEKNKNYGSETPLLMRQPGNTASYGQFGEKFTNTSTSDGTDMKTAFIRFQVGGLKDQKVKSAKLALHYQGSRDNNTAAVKLLATTANSDWDEKKVTWTTRPALLDSGIVAESEEFTPRQSDSQTIELDVSRFYNALSEEEDQITFAVTVNSNGTDYQFTAKEGATGSNASKAPQLLVEVEKAPDYMVTYDLNGGQGTAPIQAALEAGASFAAAKGTGITGPGGKQFAGWNTKADGTGTGYRTGEEVAMPAADLTLYAVYKMPVTITAKEKEVILSGNANTLDVSAQGLFEIDANAGKTQTYRVVSGGTGKGRVDKADGRTLTVSRPGTIRIKLITSETDTHMSGEATAVLTVRQFAVTVEKTQLKPGEKITAKAVLLPENEEQEVTWTSSDETVAEVDAATGEITAVAEGTAEITAAAKDGSGLTGSVSIEVGIQKVTEIVVTAEKTKLKLGEKTMATAAVLPEDASNKEVTWTSSNEAAATVDAASGEITAVAEGTAEIIAAAKDGSGITGSVSIEVEGDGGQETVKVTGITVTAGKTKLKPGEKTTAAAVVTPENASNKEVTWTSSNEAAAAVDAATGEIKAIAEGVTEITAAAADGSGITGSIAIEVEKADGPSQGDQNQGGQKPEDQKPVQVSSISIKAPSKKLAAGKKVKLTAAVLPQNAADKRVTWKVDKPKFAKIDKNGNLTLQKAGAGKSVTVTAAAADGSGKTAKLKVSIMKRAVKSIKLSGPKTVSAGKTIKLKTVIKTTGKGKVNKTLSFSSSNTKYATVDKKGRVKAKKAGKKKTVTITAVSTDGSNKKAKIKLKIR